ncbi:preprotein translocase subunit SecF [Kytococcus aerolatus]|uniref:Protein-export membrane protein SecF n=1 Tax=Kytococcus aerolatus TaxID=592308 RepID=A0A212T2N5_9MICO|nr:protein translocase subunit SecF [Kytococcus aerolatus]SNC60303.1 preprotein translocase subunit SecF [Kytococcus aerolatus]
MIGTNAFARLGNDLYTGRRQFDFIGRQKIWYLVSLGLILLSLVGLFGRGINLGLEFTGGSDFRVAGVEDSSGYEAAAQRALESAGAGGDTVRSSVIGGDTVRIQTSALEEGTTALDSARKAVAQEFDVPEKDVAASLVGPSWGEAVSKKALTALVVFLSLVSVLLALYFRTWKMALAAMVALFHDMIFTVGAYALAGFEVSPASVIGFLTILGYSLYDTVVVFDKVRENTEDARAHHTKTFAQAANMAMNQTLIRSINTSVVALLPVGAILVVGFAKLGAGTLLDLSLALFIGMAVGTFSSIFIATPVLVALRQREPEVQAHDVEVRQRQRARAAAILERRRQDAEEVGGSQAPAGGAHPAGAVSDATQAIPVPESAGEQAAAEQERPGRGRDLTDEVVGAGRTIAAGGRERHPASWAGQ